VLSKSASLRNEYGIGMTSNGMISVIVVLFVVVSWYLFGSVLYASFDVFIHKLVISYD
jgi:hypothetical protein